MGMLSLSTRLKWPRAEGGVLGEGDVSFVPPARGSNLVHFGMWTSHQNGEP